VLSVTAVNTVCTNWLVPRLGRFQVAHPNIAVRVEASSRMIDFTQEDFDIGIRGGKGNWPGAKAHMLFPVHLTAVASPAFLKRYGPITKAEDLFEVTILDGKDECWDRWFAAAGITEMPPLKGAGVEMPTQQMLGSAAIAGQGIALVTPALFDADLEAGRLVQVLPIVCTHHDKQYWLVYRDGRQNVPKIKAFRDWVLAEVALDRTNKERAAPRLAIM
jgi:LysR family transcriptional regulator, glycine cleavage system transcriptional activator